MGPCSFGAKVLAIGLEYLGPVIVISSCAFVRLSVILFGYFSVYLFVCFLAFVIYLFIYLTGLVIHAFILSQIYLNVH